MPNRAKSRSTEPVGQLAPATVESLDNLVGLTRALEEVRQTLRKDELTKRPPDSFTIRELSKHLKTSHGATRCYLDRLVRSGQYETGKVRVPVGNRSVVVNVYWKKTK